MKSLSFLLLVSVYSVSALRIAIINDVHLNQTDNLNPGDYGQDSQMLLFETIIDDMQK